jgi:hypothetical protein
MKTGIEPQGCVSSPHGELVNIDPGETAQKMRSDKIRAKDAKKLVDFRRGFRADEGHQGTRAPRAIDAGLNARPKL